MLHILLLILKIIGIILAVILGIIILLLCIILFVPIRYEISAKCDGTIESLKAKVMALWLLHFIRADVFVKGKLVKWKVRAAWITKSNVVKEKRKEEKNDEKVEEQVVETENPEEAPKVSDEGCEETPKVSDEECEETPRIHEERREETVREDSKELSKESKKPNVFEKIKQKIQSVIEKIKDLIQKKEKLTEFITSEIHVNAFKKAKKELFILLKKLKPKKIYIKLKYGFEDPYTTGQVLALLGMLYPFLGDTTEIIPDFENQVLEGSVYLKGRIRVLHFAVLAWRLFWCKDIRTSYKDIRNFKL